MARQGDFSKEWQSILCKGMYELQQEGFLCDAAIEGTDGAQYLVHSTVLAAVSTEFKSLESKPPFTLQCTGTSDEAIRLLIKILYMGILDEEPVSIDILKEVYAAASSLGIQFICDQIESQIDAMDKQPEDPDKLFEEFNITADDSVENIEDDNSGDMITNIKTENESAGESDDDNKVKLEVITEVTPRKRENFQPIKREFDPRVIEFLKGTKGKKSKKRKREVEPADLDWQPQEIDLDGLEGEEGEMKKEFEIEILDSEMVRSKKGKLVTYKCSVCGKFYSAKPRAKSFFVKHKLSHLIGSMGGVSCDQCGNKFENKRELAKHNRLVHNIDELGADVEGPYEQIDVPWEELKKYTQKEEKIIKDHKVMYKCSICDEEKSGYENFLGHKLRHANKYCFSCRHCGRGFYRKTDGKRHEEKATCLLGRRSSYVKIRNTKDGTMKSYGFLKEGEVKREDGRKWFECAICERTVVGYETFIAHKFDHAGIRPYQCEVCFTEFGRKSDWKKHMLTSRCSSEFTGKQFKTSIVKSESGNPEEVDEESEISNFTIDIGDHNRERINAAIKILETSSHDALMNNLDLSHAGFSKADIEAEAAAVATAGEQQGTIMLNKDKDALYQYINPAEKVEAEDGDTFWYKCSICHMTFQSLTNFAVHKRKHLQVKPYKCVYCKKGFIRKWDLTSHLNIHKRASRPKCNDCNKTFYSITQQKRHYADSPECTMPEDLKKLPSKKDGHQCDICMKTYTSPFYLQAHRLTHTESNLTCELCGQKFAISKNLAIHMMRHKGEKNFACEICGKRFVRNSDVTSHMVTHSEEKNQVCHICDKRFKHKNSLRSHLMLHSDTKPYLCNECGRAFVQKGNLKKHQKETHATQYNYKCELCDKYFYTDGGHRIHMKSHHSVERPYKCYYCEKSFVTRMNMARHIATHTDSRPHSCPECHRSFRMVSHIRRHLMTVHGWNKEQVMALKLKEMSAEELAKITSQPLTPEQLSNIEAKKIRGKSQQQQRSMIPAGNFIYINQAGGDAALIKEEDGEEAVTGDTMTVSALHESEVMNTMIEQPLQQHVVVVDEHGRQIELPEGFVIAESQQMELVQVQGEEVVDDMQTQAAAENTIFVYR